MGKIPRKSVPPGEEASGAPGGGQEVGDRSGSGRDHGVVDPTAKVQADLARALEIADLALERAERSENAKSRFMAELSHEVRTPLNSIQGLIRLVLKTELDSRQRRLLEMAASSGDHLLAILNQTLNFSKLEKGNIQLVYCDFTLPDLLEEIFAPYALQLEQRGVTGRLLPAPDLPSSWHGDPDRLRQILVNLLDNAAKFTDLGQVVLGVELKELSGVPTLHFRVTDSGIGIPAAKVERIFTPYSQADREVGLRYGGTGLGLSICRQLVGLMGGRIWVESREGRGTTFQFTIPWPDKA